MDEDKLPRPAMIALTVLRVVIGWHFLYEGVSKLTSTTWSAAGYMKASRGPWRSSSGGSPASPTCSTTRI